MYLSLTCLMLSMALHWTLGCRDLLLTSGFLGDRSFSALSVDESLAAGLESGHSSFRTTDDLPTLFLYHIVLQDGRGRWVVNSELGALGSAVTFVDSWAVTPTLTHALCSTRQKFWQRYEPRDSEQHEDHANMISRWVDDPHTFVQCRDGVDNTLYISVLGPAFKYSGFYARRADSPSSPVYSHIGELGEPQVYLFRSGDAWVIGEQVGGTLGVAYVLDPAASIPSNISNDAVWNYIVGGMETEWTAHQTTVLVGDSAENIYHKLWAFRSISFLPENSKHFTLRNGIAMPALGFGSSADTPPAVLEEALRLGYRMFDLARENRDEWSVGSLLRTYEADSDVPLRSEVFLTTKVWPTHLGFVPTSREVTQSLLALRTAYVDLYMIHWPS